MSFLQRGIVQWRSTNPTIKSMAVVQVKQFLIRVPHEVWNQQPVWYCGLVRELMGDQSECSVMVRKALLTTELTSEVLKRSWEDRTYRLQLSARNDGSIDISMRELTVAAKHREPARLRRNIRKWLATDCASAQFRKSVESEERTKRQLDCRDQDVLRTLQPAGSWYCTRCEGVNSASATNCPGFISKERRSRDYDKCGGSQDRDLGRLCDCSC